MKAYCIRRESKEASMKKYGPREQWRDIEQNAPLMGLEVSEDFGEIIRESATKYTEEGRKRELLKKAIEHGLELMRQGECQAAMFPRVDRETRFLFSSFPILADAIMQGLKVFFARDRFELNPFDTDSVNKYLDKTKESTAYVDTLRENSMKSKFIRAFEDHKLPNGRVPWPFDYDKATGRARRNNERAEYVLKWRDWLLIDGIGTLETCRRMNVKIPSPSGGQWTPTTVRNILRSRALVGEFYAKNENGEQQLVLKDDSLRIYTDEEFNAVGKRLDGIKQTSYYNATKHHYPPISKFVYCSCGARMYGWANRHCLYYRCKRCGKMTNATKLWEEFFPQIKDDLLSEERLIPRMKSQFNNQELIAKYEREVAPKDKEIKDFEAAKDKAFRMGMFLRGYPLGKVQEQIDKAEANIQHLTPELENLNQKLSNLKQQALNDEGIKRFCQIVSQNIDSLTKEQWEVLGRLMDLRITVFGKGLATVDIALPPVGEAECKCKFDYSLP